MLISRYGAMLPFGLLLIFPEFVNAVDFEKVQTNNKSVYFDSTFLNTSEKTSIDLSRFDKVGGIYPGAYLTDIYVNDSLIENTEVNFIEQSDKSVQPCLSPHTIKLINFNYDQLPTDFSSQLAAGKECFFLKKLLPGMAESFDSGLQRLDISVPQIYMQENARGYVSPHLWDKGVPAAFLGYTLNGYQNRSHEQMQRSFYGGLNSGVNLGEWYFRHDGSYNWQEHGENRYQSINSYVQRDLPLMESRLIAGMTNTRGLLFDTLPFRGIELTHVNQMLPSSRRGYAPDIRGVAKTNARVIIRQNGRVIYEKTVPPGPFQIADLYPPGYGGNLDVTVDESDGSSQNFQVPYASLTQMLRPGMHDYDIAVGKLDDNSLSEKPMIFQGIYQRGLTNWLTGYTGGQSNKDYYAIQLGSAVSSPIGAFSADVTHARTRLQNDTDDDQSGQSYQVGYSKFFPETDSSLGITNYRYSTSGYMDYLTAMRSIDYMKRHQNADTIWRPKNKFIVTLSQGLPEDWGRLYLSGYSQHYWNRDDSDLQYQMGYSNSYGSLTYSINADRTRDGNGRMDTQIMLSLSMPLGDGGQQHTPQLIASIDHNSNGRVGKQVGIAGSAGDDNQFSYSVTGTHYNQNAGSSASLNGQYHNGYSSISGSYGSGNHYQSATLGVSGTVLAWQQGIVMSPYISNTFAVIDAPGATDAKVSGYSAVRVDRWGHAAVPYLNAYEINEIDIDPKGISRDIELLSTSQRVAPLEGAVVVLKYWSQKGYPLLINTTSPGGKPLPFGAEVIDSEGNSIGFLGQSGKVYVRTQKENDSLTVRWGSQQQQQCRLDYHITSAQLQMSKKTGMVNTSGTCI